MSRIIANLMVQATNDILLKKNQEWLKIKHPKKSLTCVIGSGKKTYHIQTSTNSHKITYGIKMIENKIGSFKDASRWTTGKEIVNRKYFDGDLTIQKVLAHTVCHEYAHFIQVLGEYREYRSVHNDKFYEILDRIHKSGAANLVLDYLNEFSDFSELKFKDNSKIESPKYIKSDINKGDVISFKSRDGKIIKTRVLKLNPKKVKCVNYLVPYNLIILVEKYMPNTEHDKLPKPPIFSSINIKKGDVISFKSRSGEIIKDTVVVPTLRLANCRKYRVPYHLIKEVNSN